MLLGKTLGLASHRFYVITHLHEAALIGLALVAFPLAVVFVSRQLDLRDDRSSIP
jgi:hypothetical protein